MQTWRRNADSRALLENVRLDKMRDIAPMKSSRWLADNEFSLGLIAIASMDIR
jgi:hypothetical protein